MSILITDDEEIRSLNNTYRGLDRSTDVLSFSQMEGEEIHGESDLLGDIVISLDTALRQAGEYGHTVEEEMRRLLIHGLFHLLGYDHEGCEEEAARMRKKEQEYL